MVMVPILPKIGINQVEEINHEDEFESCSAATETLADDISDADSGDTGDVDSDCG